MAQLINVKLSRFEGSPWGFRLQGGKDFGTPLVVQKVSFFFILADIFFNAFALFTNCFEISNVDTSQRILPSSIEHWIDRNAFNFEQSCLTHRRSGLSAPDATIVTFFWLSIDLAVSISVKNR